MTWDEARDLKGKVQWSELLSILWNRHKYPYT